jgi:hypothetical protein
LQNELLQLHLLHKDADLVTKEWKASAKQKLGQRFQDVVQRNDELVQLEVQETGNVNAAALKKWHDDAVLGSGLDERIQKLDELVNGVWNLSSENGKYARVVRKFERWLSRSQSILSSRSANLAEDDVIFIEPLDTTWHDECFHIARKLDGWKVALKDLGTLDMKSSAGRVLDGFGVLVKGMNEELTVMGQIERDVMEGEKNWIKVLNDEESDEEGVTAGACWRAR